MRAAVAVVVGLVVAIAVACGSSNNPAGNRFVATLDGPTETPPTNSTGTANASFVDNGAGQMTFTVTAQGLTTNWTLAHIHFADAGIGPGRVIVDLATANGPAQPPNATSGTITGTITKPNTGTLNPTAPLGDGGTMTYDDLLTYMRNGNTYVNIHTTRFQAGELRGQVAAQ
jgi:CHRD domain